MKSVCGKVAAILTLMVGLVIAGTPAAAVAQPPTPPPGAGEGAKSSPPDASRPSRPATPGEQGLVRNHLAPIANGTAIRDVIVSNTDTTLAAGGSGGSEPSIAVNPANPDQIVISSFFRGWGTNSSIFGSTDGGQTWTVRDSVPAPPGVAGVSGCPCDQTFDFGRNGTLYGTFLLDKTETDPKDPTKTIDKTNVVTGSTTDFTKSSAWSWNGNPAQLTNQASADNADQPWLLVNRDTGTASQDNAYAAYDEFNNGRAQVAVSAGSTPVTIARDVQAGTETGPSNPGLRLAADPRNGTMYALYEQHAFPSGGMMQPLTVTYRLNRSTDAGKTWTLNGNSDGVSIAQVPSDQSTRNVPYKFGSVNALLGGVDHAAVDPTNGDVYVVYGHDTGNGGNQLEIRRITTDNAGTATVGVASVVTSANAALPSVAVAGDGTIGVLFHTFDGTSTDGFPTFTAHFSRSTDHGATFTDQVLQTFNSPEKDSTADRQRVLGDFQQLKVLGRTFFGVFSGNRTGFGSPPSTVSTIDPIFFSVSVRAPSGSTLASSANPSVFGQSVTFTAAVSSSVGTPTGQVSFRSDGNLLGTVPLNSGQATLGTSALSVGTHVITADYSGDVNVAPSTASLTQTVTKAPTTTALTSAPNPSVFGQAVTFTATVTSTAGTPSGTVTFSRGPIVLGTGTLDASGKASLTTSGLQVGTSSITAGYSGDGSFLASTSTPVVQVVACSRTISGLVVGALTISNSTCITDATVIGSVTVAPGAALSLNHSTVALNLTSSGASAITVCASSVTGASAIRGTAGFVLLGDNGDDGQPSCAGNRFTGSVTLDGNAAQAEIGGNRFVVNLTVAGTTGTGPDAETTATEIENNTITGVLNCTGNVPPPTNDGQPNSVLGLRLGQCSAPGF